MKGVSVTMFKKKAYIRHNSGSGVTGRATYWSVLPPHWDKASGHTSVATALRHTSSAGVGKAQSVPRLGYGLDHPGADSRHGQEIFLFSKTSRPVLGPVQWVLGSFPGVRWSGSEVDHSPLSSAQVKNKWSYTSAPLMYFHGVNMNNFTFLYYHSSGDKFTRNNCWTSRFHFCCIFWMSGT
jgi:hypothetical protein